jgi:ferritin-like protein
MANSVGLHEAEDRLDRATVDRHRALSSLQEELEAIDWYDQRIDAAEDEELKRILAHNRDEEKEHAAMVLEWLRRKDPALESALRQYLFSEGSIVDREKEVEGAEADASTDDGSLAIGSLRGAR